MSAQNSAGIQTLLDAEREAQKIVQKGKFASILRGQDRTKRVKDAKTEAQKEIEDYRKQKEDEFKKYEQEQSGGNSQAEKEAEKETDAKLKEIKSVEGKSGAAVVESLLKAVTNVEPEVPDRS